MAKIIGKVDQLDGKFYVQDEKGNIRELHVGDEIRENEIVFGDELNIAENKMIISLNGSINTIEVFSNSQFKLDNTLLNEIPSNDITTTTMESLNDALEKLGQENNQKEYEDSNLESGNKTSEAIIIASEIRETSHSNYNSDPKVFNIINLSGDLIVSEGDSATYTVTIGAPAKSDLLVTLKVSHLTTNNIDLLPEIITVTIPSGFTTQTFTVDNFNDTPYDDGDKYKVTLVSVTQDGTTEVKIGQDQTITEITDSSIIVTTDDVAQIVEGNNTVDETNYSNLLSNDIELGGNPKITSFTYFDETGTKQIAILVAGTITVDTQYGDLTIKENGDWSYISDATEDHTLGDLLEKIVINITEDNGNIGTSNFTITVKDTVPIAVNDDQTTPRTVIESSTTISGNVINDGQGDDTGVDSIVLSDFTYINESNVSTKYTFSTHTVYTTVTTNNGSLKVWTTGKWEFTPDKSIAHPIGEDHIAENFDYTIKDSDGDTASATQYIDIRDTVPWAVDDDRKTVIEGGGTITGNLKTNDLTVWDIFDLIDDPEAKFDSDSNLIYNFRYTSLAGIDIKYTFGTDDDGTDINGAYKTVVTRYGRLKVWEEGKWEYTPLDSVDNSFGGDLVDNFAYSLIDSDGDTSNEAMQSLAVSDSIPTIDNTNNTPVIVYEGASKVTFDGVSNYDKSATTSAKDTTLTLSHKLFTTGTEKAGVTSITFDGTTKTISEDSFATISDDDKGILTVNYDGTWEYTPPLTYPLLGGDSLLTSFEYTVTDSDGDSVNGNQSIQVDNYNSLFGDQTLDIATVNSSTDDNNSLTVYNASSVTFTDANWSAGALGTDLDTGFTIYTHTSGSKVLVEDQASIVDDTLSFKDQNVIDALAGIDTIILASKSIDYSKLDNIENIDLSAGNNTLEDLKYSDVINMTDSNNDLKIFGDTGDSVDFELADGWNKETAQVVEDAHTFDVYTNSNDSSVSVKIEDNIQDQII